MKPFDSAFFFTSNMKREASKFVIIECNRLNGIAFIHSCRRFFVQCRLQHVTRLAFVRFYARATLSSKSNINNCQLNWCKGLLLSHSHTHIHLWRCTNWHGIFSYSFWCTLAISSPLKLTSISNASWTLADSNPSFQKNFAFLHFFSCIPINFYRTVGAKQGKFFK